LTAQRNYVLVWTSSSKPTPSIRKTWTNQMVSTLLKTPTFRMATVSLSTAGPKEGRHVSSARDLLP